MTTTSALEMWRLVAENFDERLSLVSDEAWTAPTCCTEWNVVELVRHAIDAQRFVPRALGAVGDIEVQGDDLLKVWKTVFAAADQALSAPGAMDEIVTLPFGEMAADEGLGFPTGDLLVHTWDLARAIGADDRLDQDACAEVYESLLPIDEVLRTSQFFGPKLEPSADADAQAMLLAFVGRKV
jgi:uncharacterized protein (TIGR03086 family)